jgi:hypothetical protein
VSELSDTNGFIVFQSNDGNNRRYDINSINNYVEYGIVGDLSDLAGPVSSLTFTCYDVCDLDTPLSPVSDVNIIRVVRVDTSIINSDPLSEDKTFTAWAYLRANSQGGSDCWQNEDIGDVGAAGSATESDGTWTINASGADIWNTTDEFHYVYQSISGDCQIIARVVSVENTNSWAKAGVMIRETLDGDSKHAMMVVTPGNGTAFQRRTTTGGSSDHTAGSYVTAPYWVKLVRSGNTFTGYESSDGSTWTEVDSVSITMVTDVYIGLAVTSHSDGDLCTAEIDNIGFSTVTYEGYTAAKVDSDDTSITIPTIGSVVGTLGSWVDGLTHTAETGSSRALIFITNAEHSASVSLDSVTYGGQTMTKVIDQVVTSGGYYAYVAAFILDEDGIAAATSDTFVPNWSTTPYDVSYGSVFLQNVDQTDPIGASASNTSTSGNTITTTALSTNEGDMVILAATCGNAGDYDTSANGFTESLELDMSSSTGVDGYKAATGADETPSVTHSGANRQTLIGFVVQVNGEISGIEGDLLIAAVATDGDTSSSLAPPVGENWNEIDVNDYSNAVTLGVWWKLAEASESTSHEFTWSGGQQAYGWMMHFTGNNADVPINNYSAGGATSSTPTSPAVTTTVNNCLILRLGAFDNDNITVGDPGLSSHTPITMDTSGVTTTSTVQFVAAGAVASGATAITPPLPSGIVAGDILLLCLETRDQVISISNQNGGTWAEVDDSPQGTGINNTTRTRLTVFWSRYNGTQGDPTTTDSGNHQIGRIIAIRGTIATGDPWDVTAGGVEATSDTSGSIPGATTTVTNTLVVTVIATALPDSTGTNNFSGWANGDLISVTERTDDTQNPGNGGGLGIATGEKSTAGTYGNTAVTCGTASYKAMMSIAFKPQVYEGTVSGGAGYIGQASSGDSGTSTFTLTSPNASQMITIAIAPADYGCGSGGGRIYP